MSPEVQALVEKGVTLTAFVLLLFYFIRAISRGEWITKREFEDLRSDRDMWRAKAETNDQTVQRAVHSLHQVVGALQTDRASGGHKAAVS